MTAAPPAKPDAMLPRLQDVEDSRPLPERSLSDEKDRTLAYPAPRETPQDSNGAAALDAVEEFLRRFVAYPSEDAVVAHVLWIAHTWVMGCWESTPRIAFLSPEPGSGKSRALEVSELLVPRPVHAVNVSAAYLFRKVSDDDGLPTVLFDEIDTVFGPKAKENEDIRGLLNAGHRRGAMAGRCVIRGQNIETEELPAYCAVALAGLNDLPDTITSRSIIIRMRRRSPGETVEPFRHRVAEPQAAPLAEGLAEWISAKALSLREAWPDMPHGVEDRDADVWEPLLAVADAAAGDWPDRARVAAVALVADLKENTRETLGVRLLTDLRQCFKAKGDPEHLSTEEILVYLNGLDESPWGDLRGKELDARALSRRLRNYTVKPKNVRVDEKIHKGYSRSDLVDPWNRYLAPHVADVAHVAEEPGHARDEAAEPPAHEVTELFCRVCNEPMAKDIFSLGFSTHVGCAS